MSKQKLIFFCGSDRCGKTHISKRLAEIAGIPYFKASSEKYSFLKNQVSFLNELQYADPRVLDIFRQSGYSMIFDRGFPCEWVYSRYYKRPTNNDLIESLDIGWAALGAVIVLCQRSTYEGIVDDLDDKLSGKVLQHIHDLYEQFAELSKCKIIRLNVDDENLNRETEELLRYLL